MYSPESLDGVSYSVPGDIYKFTLNISVLLRSRALFTTPSVIDVSHDSAPSLGDLKNALDK